jgi:hypothetical protein
MHKLRKHENSMTRIRRCAMVRLLTLAAFGVFAVTCASAQETGYVKARGKPGDAGVFVNGQYKDPRYEDYTTKVTVRPKKTAHIKYELKKLEEPKPPFGRFRLGGGEPESFMSVAAGDTGAIYINDKFFGYVDELNNPGGGLLLPPGTYDLHVVSQIFGDLRQKITIEANKVTVVPVPKKEK